MGSKQKRALEGLQHKELEDRIGVLLLKPQVSRPAKIISGVLLKPASRIFAKNFFPSENLSQKEMKVAEIFVLSPELDLSFVGV